MLWKSCWILLFAASWAVAQKLESYNVDRSYISVSGISAGGAMASQFHVAFSSQIMGMGSVAGIPYHCSGGQLSNAVGMCMSSPTGINVQSLISAARSRESSGKIDSLSNLQNSRVFIWTGSADSVVRPQVSDKMEEFYKTFHASIQKVVQTGAQHTFPTESYGTACSTSASPYIGKCSYNGAYHLLNYIYGNLVQPSGQVHLAGKFTQFDQTEFIGTARKRRQMDVTSYVNSVLESTLGGGKSSLVNTGCSIFNWLACMPGGGIAWPTFAPIPGLPGGGGGLPTMAPIPGLPGGGGSLPGSSGGQHSMDTVGYAYIPSGCLDKSKECKLHIAFHGCKQGRGNINDVFARHAGYNEVAELNDIIILYPQVVSNMVSNPNACWDWWAYDNAEFDTKLGPQMKAVMKMIDRVAG